MFHGYPYTDFHELNLDGLLKEWRKFLDDNEDIRAEIKTIDDEVKALIEYVNNYFDNLDITEEVRQILYEMAADGTLGEAIKNYFLKALTSNDIDIQPVHSYIIEDGRADGISHYVVYQSMTYTPYDTLVVVSNDETEIGDDVMLREIDISDGSVIRSAVLPGGHANGITYADGYLYIAWMSAAGVATDQISKVNYNTLALDSYIGAGHNISGIAYNPDKNIFYCKGIRAGNDYPIYTYDANFNLTGSILLSVDFAPDLVMNQDIDYYNGMIVGIGAFPSAFIFFDADTRELVRVYNPDQRIGVGVPFNEPETLVYAGGDFYTCAFARLDNHYGYNVIAKVNFQKNVYDGYIKNNRYSGNFNLYVDGSYTSPDMDGSEARPFGHIGLATAVLQSYTHVTTPITVYCKKDTTVGSYSAHDISNVAIVPYGDTGTYYTMTSCRIARHSNFIIEGALIEYDSLNSTGVANVYITNSTGKMLNCYIDADSNTADNNIGIYTQYSNVECHDITIESGLADGYRANYYSTLSITGGANTATCPIRSLSSSTIRTNQKIKPHSHIWENKWPAITMVNPIATAITAIGTQALDYANVSDFTNFNIALIEVTYGTGAVAKHELCPVLIRGLTTVPFQLTTSHSFTNTWYAAISGTLDITNKTITIDDIVVNNVMLNQQYKLSAGDQAVYPYISAIYFI